MSPDVLTAADLRAAIARIPAAPTAWPLRRRLVHPDDLRHLNAHSGGQYGCPRCERIWRQAEG